MTTSVDVVTDPNDRPRVAVGHVVVNARDLGASADFYVSLGMREVARHDRVAVLELRGGTHLVVVPGDPAPEAAFDLMVDDIAAAHADWAALGYSPSAIQRGNIHDSFTMTDPAGTTVTVNSSHAVGTV